MESYSLPQCEFVQSYTYNDILMIPQYTEIMSRKDCAVETYFSKNIPLKIPIVSSPMDSVTEDQMAIEMARNGGIGVLHRYNTIDEQVKMIKKVKRAENFIIESPYLIDENESIEKLNEIKRELNIQSFLVTKLGKRKDSFHQEEETNKKFEIHQKVFAKNLSSNQDFTLSGIITARDLKAQKSSTQIVAELMTPREKMKVYVKPKDQKLEKKDYFTIYDQLIQERLEKIPIVDDKNFIVGLACEKDLSRIQTFNQSNINKLGKLYVSAAIGCRDDYLERAQQLVNNGCDCLVVDVANGHNKMTITATEELKALFNNKVDIIAGNVATGDGARRLIEAGADSIRVGIGNGSICITRIVSGSGVPQLSALLSVAPVCLESGIPLISDGGNKNSGNMCKALGLGADCLMLGRLLAGCEESPGQEFMQNGRYVKIHRGMAGYGANLSKAQKTQGKIPSGVKFSAEGVEGYVNYIGKLENVLERFVMGIKSGMSYMGARSIKELRQNVRYTIISPNSQIESNVHGISKMNQQIINY